MKKLAIITIIVAILACALVARSSGAIGADAFFAVVFLSFIGGLMLPDAKSTKAVKDAENVKLGSLSEVIGKVNRRSYALLPDENRSGRWPYALVVDEVVDNGANCMSAYYFGDLTTAFENMERAMKARRYHHKGYTLVVFSKAYAELRAAGVVVRMQICVNDLRR